MADDAKVKVGADVEDVKKAMAGAKSAVHDFAESAVKGIGRVTESMVSGFASIVTAQGKVDFSSQFARVREFESVTAHLGVAAGTSLEAYRSSVEQVGIAIGRRPGEVAAWASEVGKLTGNFKGAVDAATGISELAAATGRSIEDYRGLAVELANVANVGGDTHDVLGQINIQAQTLGVKGGVAAFAGQIEALGDTISHFAIRSEQDFTRVTSLAAVLGQGLSIQQASRVQQQVLGNIASDPLGWSRTLGRDITNEHGQVEDPASVLLEIVQKTQRAYGSGNTLKRVLQQNLGAEGGAEIYAKFKSGELERGVGQQSWLSTLSHITGFQPVADLKKAQTDLLNTDAGKRDVATAKLDTAARDLMGSSTALGRAADALQQFSAAHPIASTAAVGAAGALGSSLLGTIGKFGIKALGFGSAGSAAGGGAAAGIGGLAGLAGAGLAFLGGTALGGAAGYGIEKNSLEDLLPGVGGVEQLTSVRLGGRGDADRISAMQAAIDADKVTRDRARSQHGWSSLGSGAAPPNPASFAGTAFGELIAKAVEDGMSRAKVAAKVTVQNQSTSPVSVVDDAGHSAEAGAQN